MLCYWPDTYGPAIVGIHQSAVKGGAAWTCSSAGTTLARLVRHRQPIGAPLCARRHPPETTGRCQAAALARLQPSTRPALAPPAGLDTIPKSRDRIETHGESTIVPSFRDNRPFAFGTPEHDEKRSPLPARGRLAPRKSVSRARGARGEPPARRKRPSRSSKYSREAAPTYSCWPEHGLRPCVPHLGLTGVGALSSRLLRRDQWQ